MRAVAFPVAPPAAPGRRPLPGISVVVITRDRPEHLRRCLKSLAAQSHPPEEVIVVDSSGGPESERISSGSPGARYVRFPRGRRGMPAARNAGMRLARGEVVAFLDDDCEASPGWLAGLAEACRDPGVVGVGGRVIDPVVTLGRVRRFLTSGEPWAEPDDGDPRPAEVDFLQGGNMSFRRDALLAAGGFDPGYTGSNYREETDLCFRLRRRGHRLVYVPGASVTHLRAPRADGIRRSPDDPRREFYHARNQTYFVLKSYGLAWRPLAFYLGRQTIERTVAAARRPSPRRLAWWAAHLAGKVTGLLAGARYWWQRWLAHSATRRW
jgi:GT2 family glycosyltransferase